MRERGRSHEGPGDRCERLYRRIGGRGPAGRGASCNGAGAQRGAHGPGSGPRHRATARHPGRHRPAGPRGRRGRRGDQRGQRRRPRRGRGDAPGAGRQRQAVPADQRHLHRRRHGRRQGGRRGLRRGHACRAAARPGAAGRGQRPGAGRIRRRRTCRCHLPQPDLWPRPRPRRSRTRPGRQPANGQGSMRWAMVSRMLNPSPAAGRTRSTRRHLRQGSRMQCSGVS